jgi:hypothetical protein
MMGKEKGRRTRVGRPPAFGGREVEFSCWLGRWGGSIIGEASLVAL